VLAADQRARVVEVEAVARRLGGGEARAADAVADRDLLEHAEHAAADALGLDAGAADQEHPRGRAAVQHGELGRIDLDHGVVDSEAAQRGHQVLDRADRDAVLVGDDGAEAGIDDRIPARRDGGALGRDVGPHDHDPGVGGSRAKLQRDLGAAVKADAGAGDRRLQGLLEAHFGALPHALDPGTTRRPYLFRARVGRP
jgi:hypothetical protein